MLVKYDKKYDRSKKKVSKKIDLKSIIDTELLFQRDMLSDTLQLKSSLCH